MQGLGSASLARTRGGPPMTPVRALRDVVRNPHALPLTLFGFRLDADEHASLCTRIASSAGGHEAVRSASRLQRAVSVSAR